MAVQASDALDEQVYRSQFRNHHVEVQVQALLYHLGCHKDSSIRPLDLQP
jgi:hypothetical protein